jgi:hypothetical protein
MANRKRDTQCKRLLPKIDKKLTQLNKARDKVEFGFFKTTASETRAKKRVTKLKGELKKMTDRRNDLGC